MKAAMPDAYRLYVKIQKCGMDLKSISITRARLVSEISTESLS